MEFTLVELEEKYFDEVYSKDLYTVNRPYKKKNFIGSTGIVALDENLKIAAARTISNDGLNTVGCWVNEEYRGRGILRMLLEEFDRSSIPEQIYDITPVHCDKDKEKALGRYYSKTLKYAYREDNKILYRKEI